VVHSVLETGKMIIAVVSRLSNLLTFESGIANEVQRLTEMNQKLNCCKNTK